LPVNLPGDGAVFLRDEDVFRLCGERHGRVFPAGRVSEAFLCGQPDVDCFQLRIDLAGRTKVVVAAIRSRKTPEQLQIFEIEVGPDGVALPLEVHHQFAMGVVVNRGMKIDIGQLYHVGLIPLRQIE